MHWLLFNQRNCSTTSLHRASIPQLRPTSRGTLCNLFHTLWSIKVQEKFVVLQKEGPFDYSLLEAIVEIRDKETCYKSVSEGFTERIICAGTPYGGRGPRSVSNYSTNQFVCEIMVIHSDIKMYFNFPQKI